MNPDADGVPADDEPLARPFLQVPNVREDPAADRWPTGSPAGHHGEVRPYLLTGGRTQALGFAIGAETVVLATGVRSRRAPDAATLERSRIVWLCEQPCSAAEVSARLHLPLQVARVLISDLVAEGVLEASTVEPDQSYDVRFLERLIAGVTAL